MLKFCPAGGADQDGVCDIVQTNRFTLAIHQESSLVSINA